MVNVSSVAIAAVLLVSPAWAFTAPSPQSRPGTSLLVGFVCACGLSASQTHLYRMMMYESNAGIVVRCCFGAANDVGVVSRWPTEFCNGCRQQSLLQSIVVNCAHVPLLGPFLQFLQKATMSHSSSCQPLHIRFLVGPNAGPLRRRHFLDSVRRLWKAR